MWSKNSYSDVDRALEIAYYADGHPVRENIITKDEILNLIILLNTETDFEHLLQQI